MDSTQLISFLAINFSIEGEIYLDKLESSPYTKDPSHDNYESVLSFEKINNVPNVTLVIKSNEDLSDIAYMLRKKLFLKSNLINFANDNFEELYKLIDLAPQEAIAHILKMGYLDDKYTPATHN